MDTVENVPEVHVGDGQLVMSNQVVGEGITEWSDYNAQVAATNPQKAPDPEAIQEVSPTPEPISRAEPTVTKEPETPAIPVVSDNPSIPVKVPDKFVGPDGEVMTDKLIKSYREMEKALSKRGVPYPAIPQSQTVAQPGTAPQGQPIQAPSDPFIAQLDNDIKQFGAAPVLARLFEAATESAYQRAVGEVKELRETAQADRMRKELEHISRVDPDIISEAGYNKLTQVLRDNPHLMSSPTPFTDAYAKLKYSESVRQQVQSVQPNPKTQTMPVAQVKSAKPVEKPVLKIETPQDLHKHLSTLSPQQQDEFWSRYGASIGWRDR